MNNLTHKRELVTLWYLPICWCNSQSLKITFLKIHNYMGKCTCYRRWRKKGEIFKNKNRRTQPQLGIESRGTEKWKWAVHPALDSPGIWYYLIPPFSLCRDWTVFLAPWGPGKPLFSLVAGINREMQVEEKESNFLSAPLPIIPALTAPFRRATYPDHQAERYSYHPPK